jgi:hypothetical protein
VIAIADGQHRLIALVLGAEHRDVPRAAELGGEVAGRVLRAELIETQRSLRPVHQQVPVIGDALGAAGPRAARKLYQLPPP